MKKIIILCLIFTASPSYATIINATTDGFTLFIYTSNSGKTLVHMLNISECVIEKTIPLPHARKIAQTLSVASDIVYEDAQNIIVTPTRKNSPIITLQPDLKNIEFLTVGDLRNYVGITDGKTAKFYNFDNTSPITIKFKFPKGINSLASGFAGFIVAENSGSIHLFNAFGGYDKSIVFEKPIFQVSTYSNLPLLYVISSEGLYTIYPHGIPEIKLVAESSSVNSFTIDDEGRHLIFSDLSGVYRIVDFQDEQKRKISLIALLSGKVVPISNPNISGVVTEGGRIEFFDNTHLLPIATVYEDENGAIKLNPSKYVQDWSNPYMKKNHNQTDINACRAILESSRNTFVPKKP